MWKSLRIMRVAFIAAIFVTPMLVMVATPGGNSIVANEARMPAVAPGWPSDTNDWLKLPHRWSLYLDDHFGLRGVLTHAKSVVVHSLLGISSKDVMIAKHGHLYIRSDEAVEQSAGVFIRRQRLIATADVIVRVYRSLQGQGIKFIYMPAPNAATIATEDLPDWAKNPGRSTEYDVLLDLLHARGVPSGDMRPAMRAARPEGDLYLRNDSHWNDLGALIGFNAAAELSGHPDWRESPAAVLAAPSPLVGGDLARLLGINADVQALEPTPKFRDYPHVELSPIETTAFKITTGRSGPRVLVLGDSFTEWIFVQLIARHAAEVVWVNHLACDFDWNWIRQTKPDEVWWIPTERFIMCTGQPLHMN